LDWSKFWNILSINPDRREREREGERERREGENVKIEIFVESN